jgi:hypothetical protein
MSGYRVELHSTLAAVTYTLGRKSMAYQISLTEVYIFPTVGVTNKIKSKFSQQFTKLNCAYYDLTHISLDSGVILRQDIGHCELYYFFPKFQY